MHTPSWSALFAILLSGCLHASPLAAQIPGEKTTVALPGGKSSIPFCWCPPGKQIIGDPKKSQMAEVRRGFYIAQSELSQRVFFDVLGRLDARQKARWKRLGARVDASAYVDLMKRKAAEAFVRPDFDQIKVVGDDYPVFCVGFHEAALFCAAVDDGQDRRGPVRVTFALPTALQWQHACRGRLVQAGPQRDDSKPDFVLAAQNFPFFGLWPRWQDLSPDRRRKLVADWKKQHAKTESEFAWQPQTLLRWMAEVSDRDDKAILLGHLCDVLEQALGSKHDFVDISQSELQKVTDGNTNPWGIRHMHGNVAEWVLPDETAWPVPLDGPALGKRTVQARGGHFRHGGASVSDEEKWLALTIGHAGPAVTHLEATKQIGNSGFSSYFAGIRLVMIREIDTAGWLARLRKEATEGKLPGPAGRLLWLDEITQGVKALEAVDRGQAQKVKNQLHLLRSQYLTRAGEHAAAARELQQAGGEGGEDDLYLAGLKGVLKSDATGK